MTAPLWRRNDDWVGSEIEDAFVMVNIDTGKYVALNATASVIWQAMDEPLGQPDIEAVLAARYDVSVEDCQRAVGRLLAQMQDLKMAEPI